MRTQSKLFAYNYIIINIYSFIKLTIYTRKNKKKNIERNRDADISLVRVGTLNFGYSEK